MSREGISTGADVLVINMPEKITRHTPLYNQGSRCCQLNVPSFGRWGFLYSEGVCPAPSNSVPDVIALKHMHAMAMTHSCETDVTAVSVMRIFLVSLNGVNTYE